MLDEYSALANDTSLRDALRSECKIPVFECARTIDSTQRRARELANDNAPDWTVVTADHQSAGRGQHGRRWAAAPGSSVMFSMIVRPENHEALSLIPIRTGLAIADALDVIVGGALLERIQLKWPNDLVARDAKLGGILCEGQIRGDDARAIVGVGINVRPFESSPGVDANPECLDALAGRIVSRFDVLRAAINALRTSLDLRRPTLTGDEISRYASRDWLLGRTIVNPSAGKVLGIDERGHLIVQNESGTIDDVVTGTIGF